MKTLVLSIVILFAAHFTFAKRLSPIYGLQGEWSIKTINGKTIKILKNKTNSVTISGNYMMNINIGCNQINTKINNIGTSAIGFGNSVSTKMMCDATSSNIEKKMIEFLPKIDKYVAKKNNTVLEFYIKNKKVLELNKSNDNKPNEKVVTEQTKSIEGSYRLIQQQEGAETIERMGNKIIITFSMPEQNSVSGNSGCNNFSGQYKVLENNEIMIMDLSSTEKACEKGINAMEAIYLENLKNTERFKLDTNKLLLYKGRQLLAMFEKVN
jgi:heat shock protein HslJ